MKKRYLPLLFAAVVTLAAILIPASVRAQLYVGDQGNNSVGTYDATTGAAVNANFITGLSSPQGLLLSGNSLFVTNFFGNGSVGNVGTYNATTGTANNASLVTGLDGTDSVALFGNNLFVSNIGGTIGEYNATTGAAINANFITGIGNPQGIALFGSNLLIADSNSNRVLEYDALTGILINGNFITGLNGPSMLAVMGNSLFVSNFGTGTDGTVGKYKATTGAAINAAFIPSGLNAPDGLAVAGNKLYVVNFGGGTVGEYDATTGAAINASLITGLNQPIGIAIAVPLQLTAAASRKTHGAAGTFDVNLPLTGEPGVECRSGAGNYTLVFAASNNLVSGNASVTTGIGTVSGSPTFAGNTMTVNLTGVADVQKITVTLGSVTDSFGQVLPDTAVSANMLIGDVNGSKTVSASDVAQAKSQVGAPVASANFRSDANANGSITSSDIALAKATSGHSLP